MKDAKLHLLCRKFIEDSLKILRSLTNIEIPMREVGSVKIKEAKQLIETGYEYVNDMDGIRLYRKVKVT